MNAWYICKHFKILTKSIDKLLRLFSVSVVLFVGENEYIPYLICKHCERSTGLIWLACQWVTGQWKILYYKIIAKRKNGENPMKCICVSMAISLESIASGGV